MPDDGAPAARTEALARWAGERLGLGGPAPLEPASSDASFRRYWRVRRGGESWIVMDAPPGLEDVRPFVRVARLLRAAGLNVPEVLAEDGARGFLLLTDLGERLYLDALDEASADRLYGDALGALATLQARVDPEALPPYDRALLAGELGLFREWLLGRHLGLALSASEEALLEGTFAMLVEAALAQPVVAVHRDYHSRNLLVTERHNPGIVDFQDAVAGPVTYDLVSLLRDCYIAWPRARVEGWALGYLDLAVQSGILREEDEERFLAWFDLMGVQRHLKATGIFARLWHRDGKRGYLADIPRTLGYVREVAARHARLAPFGRWLEERVLPCLGNDGDRVTDGRARAR